MEETLKTETDAGNENAPDDFQLEAEKLKALAEEIGCRKGDMDDIATYGESALELATAPDQENLCQTAIDLNDHLQDVQERLVEF